MGLPAAMPGSVDELQVMQLMQHLRGPGLRDASLGGERCRTRLLILAAAEGHKRADDREAARTARQRSPPRRWRLSDPPLPEQRALARASRSSPGRPPRTSQLGQDRSERLGHERSDHQRAARRPARAMTAGAAPPRADTAPAVLDLHRETRARPPAATSRMASRPRPRPGGPAVFDLQPRTLAATGQLP